MTLPINCNFRFDSYLLEINKTPEVSVLAQYVIDDLNKYVAHIILISQSTYGFIPHDEIDKYFQIFNKSNEQILH